MDVIENSEILADGMIAAAAFLLSREVERRGYVQPITNMGGAVHTGSSKTNQIKNVNNRLGGGREEDCMSSAAEKHCSPNSFCHSLRNK